MSFENVISSKYNNITLQNYIFFNEPHHQKRVKTVMFFHIHPFGGE